MIGHSEEKTVPFSLVVVAVYLEHFFSKCSPWATYIRITYND